MFRRVLGAPGPGSGIMTLRAATKRLFERLRDESAPASAEFVVAPGSLEEARDLFVSAADAGMVVGFWGGASDLVPEVNKHNDVRSNVLHFASFIVGIALLWGIRIALE